MSRDDSFSIAAEARARRALAVTDAVPVLIGYVDREERYRFVNHAYEKWFGRDRSQIEGQRLVDLVGEAAYARTKRYIDRALAGETVTYDGELAYELAGFRHIEAQFTPDIAADGEVLGYYILVTDISNRKTGERELARLLHQERRRTALLELGRELREEGDPKAVASRACEVLAVQMSAPRAGYGEVDPDSSDVLIVGECAADGFPSLSGSIRDLDDFGVEMSADLRAGRGIIISDIATDPRTEAQETVEAYDALRVRALLTSPLIQGRRVAAYVYVCQDAPRDWTPDEVAFAADMAQLIWTASERARSEAALKRAEETERLLIREVDHRAKNVLAVVQSLAQLTPFVDKGQYVEALSGRIGSLARSHSLLSTSRWTGVRLDALLRQELEPYGEGSDDRVHVAGPPILIQAEAAQSLGLVLHELATNASKYGALVDVTGALSVTWAWDAAPEGGEPQLTLTWRETSARIIHPPSREGFGSTLIAKATRQLGATIHQDWRPDGLACRLEMARGALPCPGETATVGQPAAGPATHDQTLRDQRVLIVEDEALVAMELARVLTEAGAQVVGPAGSIEEALDLVARKPIDRAVLDVNLGGRMVTPVARALAAKAIPFVYLTGYQEPGVNDGPVLRKPATPELLVGALASGI